MRRFNRGLITHAQPENRSGPACAAAALLSEPVAQRASRVARERKVAENAEGCTGADETSSSSSRIDADAAAAAVSCRRRRPRSRGVAPPPRGGARAAWEVRSTTCRVEVVGGRAVDGA
jgi:hypothetical protein